MDANHIAIIADMRMCIELGRLAVCCPSRMTNTTGTGHCTPLIGLLDQTFQTSLCLNYLTLICTIPHSNAGRIITSVLKL